MCYQAKCGHSALKGEGINENPQNWRNAGDPPWDKAMADPLEMRPFPMLLCPI